ncbi:hypothetical protein AKJ09_01744 [Labilithrix luteola]|uniref:Uncharacterized protein n=2 Tax=Labilithrix luteola TaxID=1391654 RepID=A0A0K1PNG2_9BACT|nr:hypothetical protein AKJ09_01744 [Labilithrix luteola]
MHVPADVVEHALGRTRTTLGLPASGGHRLATGWMKLLAGGALIAASGAFLVSSRSASFSSSAPASPVATSESNTPPADSRETTTDAAAEETATATAPREPSTVDVAALPSVLLPTPKRAPRKGGAEQPDIESSRLAQERALILQIREALQRRKFSDASRLIARHESEFPQGQFVEQRKALHVWLTRDQGKNDQADLEAGEFKAEHPESLMVPSVGAGK